MKVMRDGTVKITEADIKAFDRTQKRDGDLYAVAKRMNRNAAEAQRRREVRAFNALSTWEREELFPNI